jgi:hypothetical protein
LYHIFLFNLIDLRANPARRATPLRRDTKVKTADTNLRPGESPPVQIVAT